MTTNERSDMEQIGAVQFMRQARDKISSDIANLSKEEIVEYFRKNIPKERIIPRHISVTS
jgi:hypothetical protein